MNTRQTSMLLAAAALGISTVMPTPEQLIRQVIKADRKRRYGRAGEPRPKGKGKRAKAAKRRRAGR